MGKIIIASQLFERFGACGNDFLPNIGTGGEREHGIVSCRIAKEEVETMLSLGKVIGAVL
jgi:hypothetical protein